MGSERILITVKTYPALSVKYGELVCTAGLRENGEWVRLYPVPFRRLSDYQGQCYRKWDWILVNLEKNSSDCRKESYRPDVWSLQKTGESLGTSDKWRDRRALITANGIHTSLAPLIKAAKEERLSLATFKPTRILDFHWEKTSPDWEPERLAKVKLLLSQGDLFDKDFSDFIIARKLPYKFKYRFVDDLGYTADLMVEDWELGQLYWNCLKSSSSENEALEKVKNKYYDTFCLKTDLHFFLGTTYEHHFVAPNPFVIVGLFYPPIDNQLRLF